jgi:hypothetical protein
MISYDLAISYTWIYDKEFIDLIEKILQSGGLKTYIIHKGNLQEVIENLRGKEISFRAYLDRASDEDAEFDSVTKILERRKCYIINPHKKVNKAVNKYLMHKKLAKRNLTLPKTFLLSSYDIDENLSLTKKDLDFLKRPFIIKPAVYSGGGEGVQLNGTSLEQIQNERIKNHSEEYLIQEKINPRIIEGMRAWFRVFWAFGKVIPTWWDDYTHIYNLVTAREIKRHHLLSLYRITRRLSRLNGLDYFSTEIALTKDHRFVLIDYVNDQCDMRLKSNHVDGVPDVVVAQFIKSMKKKLTLLKK